jgi:hypothetical protein
MDVRVGDHWGFLTNTGTIVRIVTEVGTYRIGYRELATGKNRVCLKATFRRWVRGARLEFAKDWNNRKEFGA